MPIVLGRLSRREFLGALAAGAAGRPWEALGAAERMDPHRFALLSDTHMPGDKAYTHKTGIRPWDHFEQIGRELLALKAKPAGVLVCGDCACLTGLPEDYVSLVEAVRPIWAGGLTVHFALGNHDRRGNFLKALSPKDARRNGAGSSSSVVGAVNGERPARRPAATAVLSSVNRNGASTRPAAEQDAVQNFVADRHISIVRAPRANWFLLDSLAGDDGRVSGVLGEQQLEWLGKALDANADKPALVMLHHTPDLEKRGGLEDTKGLLDVILPRKKVKAWIHGHSHVWGHEKQDDLHLVNLPATAWVFRPEHTAGWVDVRLKDGGAVFELNALKKDHPGHGQKLELKWR